MDANPRARPSIYWMDLVASAAAGWVAFAIAASTTGAPRIVASLAASFLLLRALTFLHEIAHRKNGELPGFEWAWNALVGIPMCVPSLVYVGAHLEHHRVDRFGTERDPEYAPVAHWSRARVLVFLLGSAGVPAFLVLRWGLLGPLSAIAPPLRRIVVAKGSTLAINPKFSREAPAGSARIRWIVLEVLSTLLVWSVVGAWLAGALTSAVLVQWLATFSFMFLVNQARTLTAHRFANEGEAPSAEGQLLDSITLPERSLATALVAPVGLRYHALHHLRPGIPYHALGRVHRTLVASVDARDPYRATFAPGLVATLREIVASPRARQL